MSLANKANDPATAIQSKFAQHFLGKILSQLNEQKDEGLLKSDSQRSNRHINAQLYTHSKDIHNSRRG